MSSDCPIQRFMMHKVLLTALAAAALSSSSAVAQGGDTCATATDVMSSLVFPYDSTAATTTYLAPQCTNSLSGTVDFFNDVWFTWTAPTTDTYVAGNTDADLMLGVYDGDDCATSMMTSCNDDTGVGDQVCFEAQMGNTYLIVIGGWSATTNGSGNITMSVPTPPVMNPANGNHYQVLTCTSHWDVADTHANAATFMGVNGHLATISDAAENDFIQAMLLNPAWIGGFQDPADPAFSEPAGGWKWTPGCAMSFTAWNAGEPNNTPAGEDYVQMLVGGLWNDAELPLSGLGSSRGYVIEFDTQTTTPGPCGGSNYCPLSPNSAGPGAQISTMGSSSIANNNLGFRAGPMAVGEPGIFYYGPDQIQVAFGDGNRCIGGSGGTIVRMFPFAQGDGAGFLNYAMDNTLPVHVQVVPGATLNFQAWFRDPAGGATGFNLSDATEITFTP